MGGAFPAILFFVVLPLFRRCFRLPLVLNPMPRNEKNVAAGTAAGRTF